jgi:hypothetical protein
MSQHDDIDDARAALIDQRIGQSFEFLGDVIEDPRLLDAIPDGSRLAFRDVTIRGVRFRLTAYQAPERRDRWGALVTGYSRAESRNGDSGHSAGDHARFAPAGSLPDIQLGKTARPALDALEAELRALVTTPV